MSTKINMWRSIMLKTFRQNDRLNNTILKSTKKVLSIIVVLILLSTSTLSVANSKPLDNLSNIGDKIEEGIENTIDTISNLKDGKSKILSRLQSIKESINTYPSLKNSATGLTFYTKYKTIEKQTELKLFRTTNIDIDNDPQNKPDISVKYSLYPFIERPLALSINYKLVIKRLSGATIDIDEFFEGYAEYFFPGRIIKKWGNDRVRFGIESPENNEIPSSCTVTYTFVPHFLSKKSPEHSVKLERIVGDSDAALSLLYSHAEMEETTVLSEKAWKFVFEPYVNTTISIGGSDSNWGRKFTFSSSDESKVTIYRTNVNEGNSKTFGLIIDKASDFTCELELTPFAEGGGKIEYQRNSSDQVKVDMFIEHNYTTCLFIDDLPQHLLFNWDFGNSGGIGLNAFGHRVTRAGIRNSLDEDEATAYIFFENLPSIASASWNITHGVGGSANIFCDKDGVSAHIYSEHFLVSGIFFQADIYSNKNIDMSMVWNMSEGYLRIERSETDIDFSCFAMIANGTINMGFHLSRLFDEPFELLFDDYDDGYLNATLSGSNLTISNFELLLINATGEKNIGFRFEKLVKEKSGTLNIVISVNREDNNITISATLNILKGIYISNFSICLNSFWTEPRDIDIDGDRTIVFEVILKDLETDYYIGDGYGWITIYVGAGTTIAGSFYFTVNGTAGGVVGTIYGSDVDEVINISWFTYNEKLRFNIDIPVIVISGFHLWYGDVIDLQIPKLTGSLHLINASFDSGRLEYGISGGYGSLDFSIDVKIDEFTEEFNLTFSIESIHVDTSDNFVLIYLEWADGNFTSIGCDLGILPDINLSIRGVYLYFEKFGEATNGTIFWIHNLSADVLGYLGAQFNFLLPLNPLDFANNTIELNLTELAINAHIDDVYLLTNMSDPDNASDFGEIALIAKVHGTSTIRFLGFETYHDPIWDLYADEDERKITHDFYNFTIDIDTHGGSLNLDYLLVGELLKYGRFEIINLSAVGHMFLDAGISLLLPFGLFYIILNITNDPGTYVLCDNFGAGFPITGSDFSIPFNLFDIDIGPGRFDALIRMFLHLLVEIKNGSALNHLGLEICPDLVEMGVALFGYPIEKDGLCIGLEFDGPVDYLLIDIQGFTPYDEEDPDYDPYYEFFHIDTHNQTETFDFYLIISKDLINSFIDIINNASNEAITRLFNLSTWSGFSFLSHFENDIGIRIDNITLQADDWYAYVPHAFQDTVNLTMLDWFMTGYLHIDGVSSIYLLVNDMWVPVERLGGDGFNLTVSPGYLRMDIDGLFYINNYVIKTESSSIKMNGIITAEKTFIEFRWTRNETGLGPFESMNITGHTDGLTFQDFSIKFSRDSTDDHGWKVIDLDLLINISEMYIQSGDFILQLDNKSKSGRLFCDIKKGRDLVNKIDAYFCFPRLPGILETIIMEGSVSIERHKTANITIDMSWVKNESVYIFIDHDANSTRTVTIENFSLIIVTNIVDYYAVHDFTWLNEGGCVDGALLIHKWTFEIEKITREIHRDREFYLFVNFTKGEEKNKVICTFESNRGSELNIYNFYFYYTFNTHCYSYFNSTLGGFVFNISGYFHSKFEAGFEHFRRDKNRSFKININLTIDDTEDQVTLDDIDGIAEFIMESDGFIQLEGAYFKYTNYTRVPHTLPNGYTYVSHLNATTVVEINGGFNLTNSLMVSLIVDFTNNTLDFLAPGEIEVTDFVFKFALHTGPDAGIFRYMNKTDTLLMVTCDSFKIEGVTWLHIRSEKSRIVEFDAGTQIARILEKLYIYFNASGEKHELVLEGTFDFSHTTTVTIGYRYDEQYEGIFMGSITGEGYTQASNVYIKYLNYQDPSKSLLVTCYLIRFDGFRMFEVELTDVYLYTRIEMNQEMEIQDLIYKNTTDNKNFNKIFHLRTFEGDVSASLEITVNFGIGAYAELRTFSNMSTGITTDITCDLDIFDDGEKLLGLLVDKITMSGYVNVTYIMADNELRFDFGHDATFDEIRVFFKDRGNFQITGGHDIDGDLTVKWETETFSEDDMVYPDIANPSKIIISTDGGINGTFGGEEGFKINKWENNKWKTICNLKGSINLGVSGEIIIDIYYKKVFAYEMGMVNYSYYIPCGFDIDAHAGAGGGGDFDVMLEEINLGKYGKIKQLSFNGTFSVDLAAGGSFNNETGEISGDLAVKLWTDTGINGSIELEDFILPKLFTKTLDIVLLGGKISPGSYIEVYIDIVTLDWSAHIDGDLSFNYIGFKVDDTLIPWISCTNVDINADIEIGQRSDEDYNFYLLGDGSAQALNIRFEPPQLVDIGSFVVDLESLTFSDLYIRTYQWVDKPNDPDVTDAIELRINGHISGSGRLRIISLINGLDEEPLIDFTTATSGSLNIDANSLRIGFGSDYYTNDKSYVWLSADARTSIRGNLDFGLFKIRSSRSAELLAIHGSVRFLWDPGWTYSGYNGKSLSWETIYPDNGPNELFELSANFKIIRNDELLIDFNDRSGNLIIKLPSGSSGLVGAGFDTDAQGDLWFGFYLDTNTQNAITNFNPRLLIGDYGFEFKGNNLGASNFLIHVHLPDPEAPIPMSWEGSFYGNIELRATWDGGLHWWLIFPFDQELMAFANGPYSGISTEMPVYFYGSAMGGESPYSYSWDFDASDGIQEDSTEQNPVHMYDNEDLTTHIYTATLTVTDDEGTVVTDTATITIYPPFTVDIGGPYYGIPDEPVYFDRATVSGGVGPFTYEWTFGDGSQPSYEEAPEHTYETSGIYNITLSVTDEETGIAKNDSTTVTIDMTIFEIYIDGPTQGYVGYEYSFHIEVVALNEYLDLWVDFDTLTPGREHYYLEKEYAGDTRSDITVTHIYTEPGNTGPPLYLPIYEIKVEAIDPANPGWGHDSEYHYITIIEANPPTACLDETNYAGECNVPLRFDASCSSDTDGTLVGYRWNFSYSGTDNWDTDWLTDLDCYHTYTETGTYTVKLEVKDDYGGTDSITAPVTIAGALPVPIFTYSPDNPYTDEIITFDATASYDPDGNDANMTYDWNFRGHWLNSDNYWYNDLGPTENHSYQIRGWKLVKLRVHDEEENKNIAHHWIYINKTTDPNGPEAEADIPDSAEPGNSIHFTGDASGDSPFTWFWDFGDETTSDIQNPIHTYANEGTYNVAFTVTDTHGRDDTDSGTINIYEEILSVSIAQESYSAQPYEYIDFYGYADGGEAPYSWFWDFGDGCTSNQQNPSHRYYNGGNYIVDLIVTDSEYNWCTDTASVEIGVNDPPLQPTLSILNPPTGPYYRYHDITFTADADDPNDDPLEYYWEFYDGMIYQTEGWCECPQITYSWSSIGEKAVRVKVRERDYHYHESDWSDFHYIDITDQGGNDPPVARFTWSPNNPDEEETVNFDASDSDDPDGTIISYTWDFDNDGAYDDATGEYATYSWPDSGNYIIRLKVKDNDDAVDTKSSTIVVGIGMQDPYFDPEEGAITMPMFGEVGEEITMTANVIDPNGHELQYRWNIAWLDIIWVDETIDNSNQFKHTFLEPGIKIVRVQAAKKDYPMYHTGWSNWFTITITGENQDPVASFSYSPNDPYQGETITFNAGNSYDPEGQELDYQWDWTNDGNWDTSWSTNPIATHSYSSTGTYTVKLRVRDEQSNYGTCTDSVTVSENTNYPPNKPSTPNGPNSGYVGISYTYSTSTTDPDGHQISYLFNWGDGTNSGWLGPYDSGTPCSASHSWLSQGTYSVIVTAKDIHNLESTPSDAKTVVINNLPPEWVSPTGHQVGWVSQSNAYDGSTSSFALYATVTDTGECNWPLVLTLNSPITCDGFKINAKNNEYLIEMKIQLFAGNTKKEEKTYVDWDWPNNGWMQDTSILAQSGIDKVKIWFTLSEGNFLQYSAKVYEFEFHQTI
jgi:PKD repeat protein